VEVIEGKNSEEEGTQTTIQVPIPPQYTMVPSPKDFKLIHHKFLLYRNGQSVECPFITEHPDTPYTPCGDNCAHFHLMRQKEPGTNKETGKVLASLSCGSARSYDIDNWSFDPGNKAGLKIEE